MRVVRYLMWPLVVAVATLAVGCGPSVDMPEGGDDIQKAINSGATDPTGPNAGQERFRGGEAGDKTGDPTAGPQDTGGTGVVGAEEKKSDQ